MLAPQGSLVAPALPLVQSGRVTRAPSSSSGQAGGAAARLPSGCAHNRTEERDERGWDLLATVCVAPRKPLHPPPRVHPAPVRTSCQPHSAEAFRLHTARKGCEAHLPWEQHRGSFPWRRARRGLELFLPWYLGQGVISTGSQPRSLLTSKAVSRKSWRPPVWVGSIMSRIRWISAPRC